MKNPIAQWPVTIRLIALLHSTVFVLAVGAMIVAGIVAVRPDWAQYAGVIASAVALIVVLITRIPFQAALAELSSGKPFDQTVATVATDVEQALIPGLPPITPELIDAIAQALMKHQQPLLEALLKSADSHTALAAQVIQANTPKQALTLTSNAHVPQPPKPPDPPPSFLDSVAQTEPVKSDVG